MTSRPARFALLAALVLPAGAAWGLMPTSQTATPPKSAKEQAADALDTVAPLLNPQDKKGVGSLADGIRQGDNIFQYGNWYGPGWWGGGTNASKPGNLPPVDELDACAQRHDFGYQVAEKMGKIYGKAEELRLKAIADAIAVRDAMRLDPDPSKWNPPAADPAKADRYRNRIITGFDYESSGYDAAGKAVNAADWVTSPIENWELDRSNQLDAGDLEKQVNTLVNNWNKNNPPPPPPPTPPADDEELTGGSEETGDADEPEAETGEPETPPEAGAAGDETAGETTPGAGAAADGNGPEDSAGTSDGETPPDTETEPESPPDAPEAPEPEITEPETSGDGDGGSAGGGEPETGTDPETEGPADGDAEDGEAAGDDGNTGSSGDADDGSAGEDGNDAGGQDSGETTTTSGYVENSSGRITLTETRGPDGSLVSVTTTETRPDGTVVSQTTYPGGTGEGQTTTSGNDLQGSEPESDGEVSPEAATGGYNTSGSFAAGWSQGQQQRGTDGGMILAGNTQMGEAANVGNQTISDADSVRDGGGQDYQSTRDNTTRTVNKADQANSWGKALGDAVEQGITEGGKAFGNALGGAAADQAIGAIFGSPDSDDGADEGKTDDSGQGPASGGASAKGKQPEPKDGDDQDEDDSSSGETGGCDEPCDDGSSGGGGSGSGEDTGGASAPSDDPLGVTGSTDNDDGTVTIRYGCGYSWTGAPPGPSRCPICSRETVSTETNPGTGGDSSDDAGTGEEGPGEPTEEANEPPAGDPYIRDIIEYDE